jgi:hypothetical protein
MATAAARAIAARSIHIKIYPAARSMPERREVLRVIERFGEVEMFKSLKVCSGFSHKQTPTVLKQAES